MSYLEQIRYPAIAYEASSVNSYENHFACLALSLARSGLGQTWPNPSVGAVLVSADGKCIVGCGVTRPGGRPHAETEALNQAGFAAKGATLYVTLEPCAHHGMTPPCTEAILKAGVAEVVYGIVDPDPRVAGQGLSLLEMNGVRVRQGDFAEYARWLTLGHSLRITERRPFVQVKLAVGADGRVPVGNGAPVWVTCDESRAYAHLLRAQADAIAVGSGTLAADNPQLTCRLPGLFARSPIRVVFSAKADCPPSLRLFEDIESVPVWVVTSDKADKAAIAALKRAGANVIKTPLDGGRIAIKSALEALAALGITRLFVEGGPLLAGSFLDAGMADEVLIFRAAKVAGPGGLPPFGDQGLEKLDMLTGFQQMDVRRIACDSVHTYRRREKA
ncbi:MAG: bifunctional diaminohydroxyphosphoribosylaminopyrimidine deaminase/5-amino-6-(5-phosphoribosylamino)uracil reductase RibD [Chitinophagales bacterium]|nr:bifunctional diaminohydroxyphosphoribosylaminopyrimidine deaminase/5-amino-6-(5-phosphoribosylamino)uracil reductase RibD [Hyphomicrobiales bacterium]